MAATTKFDRNHTALDARERVNTARIGSLADATLAYQLELHAALLAWAEEVAVSANLSMVGFSSVEEHDEAFFADQSEYLGGGDGEDDDDDLIANAMATQQAALDDAKAVRS